jgi:predicted dehydrogenase/threonine dehydrogenase-like Zn-dependent dehydrogenase
MRQILFSSAKAIVARMPRPTPGPGVVLVRTRFSLISTGTELLSLRPFSAGTGGATAAERLGDLSSRARFYLGKAVRNPRLAVDRASSIVGNAVRRRMSELAPKSAGSTDQPATEMNAQGSNTGYSLAGEVVAVGDGVSGFSVGDRVACAGAGQANHADYVAVKANLVCRVPDGCSLEEAATATVGAIAMQGVRRAAPQLGEIVCVIGLGLIGMITAQLLRAAGCRVIGFDLDAERCRRSAEFGVAAADTDFERVRRLVRDMSGGQGADATIVAAASLSNAPVNNAMELTRRRGRVVLVGAVGLKVERGPFYNREIDLLMSTSYGPGRYDPAYEDFGHDYPYGFVRWTANRNMQSYLQLIAEKRIGVMPLVDRITTIDDAPAAYAELASAQDEKPLAVLISYPDAEHASGVTADGGTIRLRGHRPLAEGRINYALVGAGNFGTQMLVPMMERRKDRFQLRGVVSRDGVRGGNFARARQVEILSSDYGEILKDDRIDLVVIATRHRGHAEMVVQALEAGKHVFVEKPLAIDWDGLDRVREAVASHPDGPRLMVGFNRRFAPALAQLRQEFAKGRTPLVVDYRVNAGYLPLDHWVHGPEGGGRNIGEACHMYDVFASLAGAPVVSVSATAIDPGARPYARNDNFSATLRYADGSVCTLTYTALGPASGLAKERIEIFANNNAWIVDDFKSLLRTSDGATIWSASAADKGHFEELSQFGDCIANGTPAPIPVEQLLETTAVAFRVEDLIFGRDAEDA